MRYTRAPSTDFKPAEDEVKARMTLYRGAITLEQAESMLIREHALGLPPQLPARVIDTAAFIGRIPVAVWVKVQAARAGDAALDQGVSRLIAGATVDAANADLQQSLAGLVAAGVLTVGEANQILGF